MTTGVTSFCDIHHVEVRGWNQPKHRDQGQRREDYPAECVDRLVIVPKCALNMFCWHHLLYLWCIRQGLFCCLVHIIVFKILLMFQLFFLSAGSILFTFVGLIAYIYFIDDDLAPH